MIKASDVKKDLHLSQADSYQKSNELTLQDLLSTVFDTITANRQETIPLRYNKNKFSDEMLPPTSLQCGFIGHTGYLKLDDEIVQPLNDVTVAQELNLVPAVNNADVARGEGNTLSQESVREKVKKQTTRSQSFNKLGVQLASEMEAEIRLLKNRNIINPKRHYRNIRGFRKGLQVGRVIEGPAEYYSSRLPRKARSLVDELLADAKFRKVSKKKFKELQELKRSIRKKRIKRFLTKPTWSIR